MTAARIGLVAVGLGFVAVGTWLVIPSFGVERLIGLGLWLAGVIVVHDFVFVPVIAVVRRVLLPRFTTRRFIVGPRLRPWASRVSRSLFLVAGSVSVVAVPEVWAQHRGAANPTILPGGYGPNLGWLWIAVAVVIVVVHLIEGVASRRFRL